MRVTSCAPTLDTDHKKLLSDCLSRVQRLALPEKILLSDSLRKIRILRGPQNLGGQTLLIVVLLLLASQPGKLGAPHGFILDSFSSQDSFAQSTLNPNLFRKF